MALSAWPALRPFATAQRIPGSGEPEDETFWAYVRSEFEIAPEFANLVSAVRGNFTKANREIAFNEATRLNQLPAPRDLKWQEEVRKRAAALIGAPIENVALLRNTTEGVTTVLANWPLKPGDEILTSSAEHGPFYDTLAQRTARDHITIRLFHYPAPVTSQQSIVDSIDRALTPRTRLVMIGHIVLLGQINPVRAIADRAHRNGAKLLVDGVLGLGHVPTDVRAMDCDFYAAGFHKFACGPRATAVFYVRPGLVGQLPPLFGCLGEDARGLPQPRWNSDAMDKYEVFGAHPEGQFYALGNAIDFISGIGVDRIQSRYFYLTSRWLTRAQRLPKFRSAVTLDAAQCAGLVAWELDGTVPDAVRKVLSENRVRIGRTESYAGFFGIPADAPRFLFIANAAPFTLTADVDHLAEAIDEAVRKHENSARGAESRTVAHAVGKVRALATSVSQGQGDQLITSELHGKRQDGSS
jgi:selenocysteine lyase/cysteine desulfurase